MRCNYHTHSTYCDGKDPISLFVEKAIEKEFDYLGFSAHAPLLEESNFAIKEEDIPEYLKEIEELKKSQNKVSLLTGLECDFIPGGTKPFAYYSKNYNLDFIIGGIHLVKPNHSDELWFIDGSKREFYDEGLKNLFDNNIQKAVTRFWEQSFEMIETEKFDIIAHLDKIKMHNQHRFFSGEEKWYSDLVEHALNLIRQHDIIIEINPRGIYKGRCDSFYPSDQILRLASKKDIPFVISSDAHKAEELGLFYTESAERLKEAGIHELVYLDGKMWKYYPL